MSICRSCLTSTICKWQCDITIGCVSVLTGVCGQDQSGWRRSLLVIFKRIQPSLFSFIQHIILVIQATSATQSTLRYYTTSCDGVVRYSRSVSVSWRKTRMSCSLWLIKLESLIPISHSWQKFLVLFHVCILRLELPSSCTQFSKIWMTLPLQVLTIIVDQFGCLSVDVFLL